MTLRRKILLTISFTLLVILAIIAAFTKTIYLSNYSKLEEQEVKRDLERVIRSLQSSFEQLSILNSDWAAWDDTYQFIQDRDQEYIDSNIVPSTFESLNINFIIFLDVGGKIVFWRGYDAHNSVDLEIPYDFLELLYKDWKLAKHFDTSSNVTGILNFKDSNLLINSRPILNSQSNGPIKGTLIMARFLEEDEFASLSNITQLTLHQYPIGSTNIPEQIQKDLLDSKETMPSSFQSINDQEMAGYILVKDIQYRPAFYIQFSQPRNLYLQGKNSVNLILFLIFAAGIVSGFVVYLAFERQVLSRLSKLIISLTSIRKKGRWSDRVPISGRDEITSMGSEINRMLDAREKLDHTVKQSEERFRTVVEAQTELISRLQPNGKYNFVNQAYCKYFGMKEKQIIGSHIKKIFSKSLWNELHNRFKKLTPDNPIVSVEEKIISPTGEEQWQQWVNKGLFDLDGKLMEVQSVGRDITERKKVELELEHRLKLEQLLIEISTSFINLDATSIDNEINNALERIGRFTQVDRGYVFLVQLENPQLMVKTHEWCAPIIKTNKDNGQSLRTDAYPWLMEKLTKFNNIFIPRVIDMPIGAYKEKELFLSQSIQSLVYFPLVIERKLIGFIGLDSLKKERTWSEEVLTILESVAITFASAIDRTSHEKEISMRQSHLATLHEITRTAFEGINYIDVVSILVLRLPELINAHGSFISLWDENGKNIISTGYQKLKGRKGKTIRITEDLSDLKCLIQESKDVFTIENTINTSEKVQKIAGFLDAKALIGVPLLSGEKVLGIAFILFNEVHQFTSQEIDTCKQAANILSLIIQKIQALETSRRRAEELEALRANINDVSSELEVSTLLQSILDRAVNLMKATGGDLAIYEEKENNLKIVACKNMGKNYNGTIQVLGEGASGKVAQTHIPLIIEDYDKWGGRSDKFITTSIHCVLSVPILIGSKLLGVIDLFNSELNKKFRLSDQNLLTLFAQQAAIALDNAHLFHEVQRLARTDTLTGLLNRHALEEFGKYEIIRMQRKKQPIALAMLDVDRFKKINDTYGHVIGDQVLKELAQIVRSNIRNIDILGRYGGDELIIVMPETDSTNAQTIAKRLRRNIEETSIPTDIGPLYITASIGISIKQDNQDDLNILQQQADKAMYAAKKAGRNTVRLYKP